MASKRRWWPPDRHPDNPFDRARKALRNSTSRMGAPDRGGVERIH